MNQRTILWGFVVGALALGLISPAFAASACYMKIEGVKGEARDAPHKDWIEIESIRHGFDSWAREKKAPGQITIVKVLDKASPKLAEYLAQGKHIDKVVLSCRKAGKEQQEYLRYKLSDLQVSSIQPQGEMEEVSFTYQKIIEAGSKEPVARE